MLKLLSSLCLLKFTIAWGALGHMLTARIAEITLDNN